MVGSGDAADGDRQQSAACPATDWDSAATRARSFGHEIYILGLQRLELYFWRVTIRFTFTKNGYIN